MLATAVVAMTSSMGGLRAEASYVNAGSSGGTAVYASLQVGSLAAVTANLNNLSNTAPAPYSSSLTAASGSISLGTLGALLHGTTGALNTTISSNITGSSASGMANASTTVNNLNLGLVPALATIQVLATTLTSTSTAGGSYNSLTASGNGSVTGSGLSIKVLGVDVTAAVEAAPAGTLLDVSTVTGLGGLLATGQVKIGVDIAQVSGDGITSKSVVTDNVLIQINSLSVAGIGVLSGSIAIGQSQAMISATVPEPSSALMMGVGLGLAGFARVRRIKARRFHEALS